MSIKRTIGYVFLAILASAVLGTLLMWAFTKNDAVLILSGALAVVFLAYFITLLVYNTKYGWQGEKGVRARTLSEEKLYVAVYPTRSKKKFLLNVYEPLAGHSEEEFAALSKALLEPETADMGAFDDVYVGYFTVKDDVLAGIVKKTVALPEDIKTALEEDPSFKSFFRKNNVIAY